MPPFFPTDLDLLRVPAIITFRLRVGRRLRPLRLFLPVRTRSTLDRSTCFTKCCRLRGFLFFVAVLLRRLRGIFLAATRFTRLRLTGFLLRATVLFFLFALAIGHFLFMV